MANVEQGSFESRVTRISRAYEMGGAYEPTGTLGRSRFDATIRDGGNKMAGLRDRLRLFAWIIAGACLFKAVMIALTGPGLYDARLELLAASGVPGPTASALLLPGLVDQVSHLLVLWSDCDVQE